MDLHTFIYAGLALIGVLVLIVALSWIIDKFFAHQLPKGLGKSHAVKVLNRTPLDNKRQIVMLTVAQRVYLMLLSPTQDIILDKYDLPKDQHPQDSQAA